MRYAAIYVIMVYNIGCKMSIMEVNRKYSPFYNEKLNRFLERNE